jgi:hypothetical protein
MKIKPLSLNLMTLPASVTQDHSWELTHLNDTVGQVNKVCNFALG